MDKNNTMFMTIVAVSTLIVAVVGATFAYFTSADTATGTTKVETTTKKVGSIILNNPTNNISMKITAEQMAEDNKGAEYYATTSSADYVLSKEYIPVSSFTITGGENDAIYLCTYRLNIEKSPIIKKGDATLTIDYTLDKPKPDYTSIIGYRTFDLFEAPAYIDLTFEATGDVTDYVVASISLKYNNVDGNQDHLIGKTINLKITNSDLECTIS